MFYNELVLAGGLMTITRGMTFFLNRWFCVRNAPRWLRNASDLVSALLGLRWIAGVVTDWPAGLWSALIVFAFGIIAFTVLIYHLYSIIRLGDNCREGNAAFRDAK